MSFKRKTVVRNLTQVGQNNDVLLTTIACQMGTDVAFGRDVIRRLVLGPYVISGRLLTPRRRTKALLRPALLQC